MTVTPRGAAGALLALALAVPATVSGQTCIGNSPDVARFSTAELSTGGVNLPQDLALHMVGLTHFTDDAFFGLGKNVYRVEYGAMTGIDNAEDYGTYAYRGTARWLFDLPLPATAPEGLDVCWTLGTKLAAFGYTMQYEAVLDDQVTPDQEVGAMYFGWGIPVTANAGYRIALNETFDVVPYIAPGVNPQWGGLIADEDAVVGLNQEVNELGGRLDYFSIMGVALNHDIFRVGLFVESGMDEANGTRVGLEGGLAW